MLRRQPHHDRLRVGRTLLGVRGTGTIVAHIVARVLRGADSAAERSRPALGAARRRGGLVQELCDPALRCDANCRISRHLLTLHLGRWRNAQPAVLAGLRWAGEQRNTACISRDTLAPLDQSSALPKGIQRACFVIQAPRSAAHVAPKGIPQANSVIQPAPFGARRAYRGIPPPVRPCRTVRA